MEKLNVVFGYRYGNDGFLLVGSEDDTKSLCDKHGIDYSNIESRPIRFDRKSSYNEDWLMCG